VFAETDLDMSISPVSYEPQGEDSMFKIILESANGEQLDKIYDANNVEYLQQDEAEFEMLGELFTCSYDVFSSKDMDQLLLELEKLKASLVDANAIKHIEEIRSLAQKCRVISDSRLIFTPL